MSANVTPALGGERAIYMRDGVWCERGRIHVTLPGLTYEGAHWSLSA
jgi:hypothetical protein